MKFKALLTAFLAVACCASAKAEDLAQFGISDMKVMTEADGSGVRGQGAASAGMASFQLFAFDYLSGSSLNLQTSSINVSDALSGGTDTIGFEALTDAFVGISEMNIGVNEFSVSTSGFELGSLGGSLSNLIMLEIEAPEVEAPEAP